MTDIPPDFSQIYEPYRAGMREFLSGFFRQTHQVKMQDRLIKQHQALRVGENYLRATSQDGSTFTFPVEAAGCPLIAWSGMDGDNEVLCAVNLSEVEVIAYVTVDWRRHENNSRIHLLFGPPQSRSELNSEVRNGKAVRLTVPPSGFVIYN